MSLKFIAGLGPNTKTNLRSQYCLDLIRDGDCTPKGHAENRITTQYSEIKARKYVGSCVAHFPRTNLFRFNEGNLEYEWL